MERWKEESKNWRISVFFPMTLHQLMFVPLWQLSNQRHCWKEVLPVWQIGGYFRTEDTQMVGDRRKTDKAWLLSPIFPILPKSHPWHVEHSFMLLYSYIAIYSYIYSCQSSTIPPTYLRCWAQLYVVGALMAKQRRFGECHQIRLVGCGTHIRALVVTTH